MNPSRRREILLCVDLSYQVYRATCAHPMLTSGGTFTGGLYGFFAFLGKAVRETRATRLVFTCDTKPYRRSFAYPEYKRIRKNTMDPKIKERYEVSRDLVTAALLDVGAHLYGLEGFESDDFMGAFAIALRHRYERIYLGSNDSDLWQLLWIENLAIYRTGIEDLVTGAWLQRQHGLTPDQYMLATALMGTHNDVEGIRGVGQKTAFAAVKDTAKLRELRGKHADVIDRNLSLIKLPHDEFPREQWAIDAAPRGFSPRDLYRALGRYDIDVTDSMVRAFEQTSV